MSVLIHEPVSVVAVFEKGQIKPILFRWKDKKISIENISFMWQTAQGEERLIHFTAVASRTLYELIFDVHSLAWKLEQIETNTGISTI